MTNSIRRPAKTRLIVASAALVLSLAACNGPTPPDELARAVAVGERPVAMKGSDTFFGGKIGVTVTISRGIGHGTGATGKNGNNARISDTFGWDKDDASAFGQQFLGAGLADTATAAGNNGNPVFEPEIQVILLRIKSRIVKK